MKKFSLPEETISKVLNYLAGKPFSEVFQLIKEVQEGAAEIKEENS